jgi:DNA polymerase
MSKAAQLELLFRAQSGCKACPRLLKYRTQVVRGRGNPEARIVMVGEGPGEEEDKCGEPFRGRAGGTLDEIIESVASDRPGEGASEEDFFILNSVACRPCMPNPISNRLENMKPAPDEIKNCRKWLHKAVRIIDPNVLVLIGEPACHAFGIKDNIGKVVGKMVDVQVDGVDGPILYAAMPIYHPSFLNRNRNQPQYLESTKKHLAKVVERVWAFHRIAKGLSPVRLEEEES